MKMVSLIWFLSILAFLVADVKTGASEDKDIKPLRCHTCGHIDNSTNCLWSDNKTEVNCTPELPYCGTSAKSPDFISSLSCVAVRQTPCALIQATPATYEITCRCYTHLCNKPFTREFRNELLKFSPTNLPDNTTRELWGSFINSSVFANVTSDRLYDAITLSAVGEATKIIPVTSAPIPRSTVLSNTFNKANAPRAEALKHEATVPSDDDEDEGEGSGSFEDAKPQVPAAPAAPSSFLPANENSASSVNINLLATIPFISLYTMA